MNKMKLCPKYKAALIQGLSAHMGSDLHYTEALVSDFSNLYRCDREKCQCWETTTGVMDEDGLIYHSPGLEQESKTYGRCGLGGSWEEKT